MPSSHEKSQLIQNTIPSQMMQQTNAARMLCSYNRYEAPTDASDKSV